MTRIRVALVTAVLILCAGCTSSTAHSAGEPSAASPGPVPAAGDVTRALPGCTTATQAAPALPAGDTAMESVPGSPFGVAIGAAGRWAFVSLGSEIGLYRLGSSRLPVLVRRYPAPGADALGDALSGDGKYLVTADDASGATVLSVSAAERGAPGAVIGELRATGLTAAGAIETAVSIDGRFAFVSLEDTNAIAVFRLTADPASGSADYVGSIPAQIAPVGLAISPDGRWLYSTSEVERPPSMVGSLTVISVAKAETDPAHSIVARVAAGCNPVRVVASADGRVVWVTARASDALLAFSSTRLRTDPAHALLADVQVGELPVGLTLARADRLVVVADSDRFNVASAHASLAVVDVADALAGRPALLGYLPAGGFPREMALEPSGRTLLVTNYTSGQLEVVNLAELP
jgi:DNA-binding beta-propeller fold protein YncE